MSSLTKTASTKKEAISLASIIPALVSSSIALPGLLRTLGNLNTGRKADNAWADALMEDPKKSLVPGLEQEFKDLYFDSPYAAGRLLDVF